MLAPSDALGAMVRSSPTRGLEKLFHLLRHVLCLGGRAVRRLWLQQRHQPPGAPHMAPLSPTARRDGHEVFASHGGLLQRLLCGRMATGAATAGRDESRVGERQCSDDHHSAQVV